MNLRLPHLSAALVSLLLSAPARATTPLFTETFAGNTGDWSTSQGAASFDNSGWSCTSTCQSQSAIKLGTGSNTGAATSPLIPLPSGWSKASVTVSFQAAAWYGTKNSTMTLSVIENNQTTTNVTWSVRPIAANKTDALQIADLSSFTADSTGKDYELEFATRGSFQLSFETSGSEKRLYLDSVVVVAEEIVSGLTPLPAPENLSSSDIGYTGFSLSWDSVSGATGYSVTVSPAGGTVSVNGTTASVTGLTPGETYTAYVTALGDGTTNDDSAPAELTDITTLASAPLSAPTNLHTTNIEFYEASVAWDGVADATGYTVTITPSAGTSVSDNGTTATLSGLAEGATYTVSVVANGNGVETADSPAATLSVTTATAPDVTAPVLSFTGVSASAFTVSWPAQSSASFSVRAWTQVITNDFTEGFEGWLSGTGILPAGWTTEGGLNDHYTVPESPIKFEKSGHALTSPVFPGSVTTLSFHLCRNGGNADNASTFSVYGSSGEDGATWTLLRAIDLYTEVSTSGTDFSLVVPAGIHQFRFTYTKGAGNCGFGNFEVSGTDVCEVPVYLQGYGPAPANLDSATTCTIANPAAGETNYVEVTAWGLTGRSAVSVGTVVPRDRAAVISVK